ncbi:MAG: hypothetical protein AB1589_18940 [Cyanobacteriota bacterium]
MSPKLLEQLITLVVDKVLIGGLLIVAGFGINRALERFKFDLGLNTSRHGLASKSQIDFKERQLAEFYGPIYALLKRIQPIDDMWNQGKVGSVDKLIVEIIRDSNNRIVDIILAKSHLIDGDGISESYTRFLTHVAVWHAFWDTPDRDWSDYAQLRDAQYDSEFEKEIFQTTEKLKQELYVFYQEYGLPASQWAQNVRKKSVPNNAPARRPPKADRL